MIYSAWHSGSSFTGTSDQLISAGLIPDSDVLPGQPNRPKIRVCYTEAWEQVPGRSELQRYAIYSRGRSRFEIIIRLTDEEREYRSTSLVIKASKQAPYLAREYDSAFQRFMSSATGANPAA